MQQNILLDRSSDALQDIVNKVQIQTKFYITHLEYQPLELLPEVVTRLQQLPENLQRQYLGSQLRNFLYSIYFRGEAVANSIPVDRESDVVIEQDTEFYYQLHASNCGTGYFDRGWEIIQQESDDRLDVRKNGITLHVLRERHLHLNELASVGNTVAIKMPRNLVEPEYYVAVGNAGLVNLHERDRQPKTTYIYFNFSPVGAIAAMHALTKQLNQSDIPFTFKVLCDTSSYRRYDSGILHFDRSHYPLVQQFLKNLYADNQSHFYDGIPLLTKFLAPGLSLAEKPDFQVTLRERFGLHRCQIIADALLDAWYKNFNSPKARFEAIARHFSSQKISLQHPYLNANSTDYSTLDS